MYQPFVRQPDINCELPSMDSFHPTHSPVVFMCFFDKNVGMTDWSIVYGSRLVWEYFPKIETSPLPDLIYYSRSSCPLSREDPCYDIWPRFLRSHPRDRPLSRLSRGARSHEDLFLPGFPRDHANIQQDKLCQLFYVYIRLDYVEGQHNHLSHDDMNYFSCRGQKCHHWYNTLTCLYISRLDDLQY